jgi:uncharacterized protein (TIRG00374 family)
LTSVKKKFFSPRDIIVYVFSLGLAALFLYYAFQGVDPSSLWQHIEGASLTWILALIVFQMAAHYFRALRWKAIMSSLNPDVSSFNLFGAVIIGYGFNSIVPRLGEVARAVIVGKTENISKTSIFGTVIVERIIDILLFAFAVILSGWIYEGDIYSGQLSWLKLTIILGTGGFLGLIVFLVLLIRYKERFSNLIITFIGRFSVKIAGKLDEIFHKMMAGFSTLRTVDSYFKTAIYSVLIMVGYAATTWAGFHALGLEAKYNLGLSASWVIMSISSIGVIIPTPGGIGSFHTITKTAMAMLYNCPLEVGLAFATFIHGITYLLHILSAIVFIIYFKFKLPGVKKEDIIDIDEN